MHARCTRFIYIYIMLRDSSSQYCVYNIYAYLAEGDEHKTDIPFSLEKLCAGGLGVYSAGIYIYIINVSRGGWANLYIYIDREHPATIRWPSTRSAFLDQVRGCGSVVI